MSKYFVFIFYIFSIAVTYSQNIIGIVKDSNGFAIENATVFVWNSDQKQKLLGYYYCNEIGNFEISLKINETVFIEITNINFQTFSKTVKSGDKISVILQKSDVILDEVIIKTEKAIQVKKDSTFYDPKKFLNGTEKKIEDLLKKLPGITVNESTGQIKFKGKNITTVKLENDDLFGSNYTIGTRHISVDMVEQVQAIENYSDNSLLKGIEDSDKVVLNLRIKKNKTDFSGDVTTESGFEKKIFSSNEATILGINKNVKMFGFISQANFGIDSNNLDPFFEEVEIGSKNFDFLAKKNISLYTRIHGMDVYEDQHSENNFFFPFRCFQKKQINEVIAISENGKQHLLKMVFSKIQRIRALFLMSQMMVLPSAEQLTSSPEALRCIAVTRPRCSLSDSIRVRFSLVTFHISLVMLLFKLPVNSSKVTGRIIHSLQSLSPLLQSPGVLFTNCTIEADGAGPSKFPLGPILLLVTFLKKSTVAVLILYPSN